MLNDTTATLAALLSALDAAGIDPPEGARRSLQAAHHVAALVHDRNVAPVPVARMIADGATDDEIEQAILDAQLRHMAIVGSGSDLARTAHQIARPHIDTCRALAPKVTAALAGPYTYALDVATAWPHGTDALDHLGPLLEANPDQAAEIVKARQSTVDALAELDRTQETLSAFGKVSVANFFVPTDPDAAPLDLPARAADAFYEGWLDVAAVDGLEPKLTAPGERDDAWVQLDLRIAAHNAKENQKGGFTRPVDLHRPVFAF